MASKSEKGALSATTTTPAASAHTETVVETQTVVEDRTEAPAEVAVVEYESTSMELTPGTVLTTYGEPVGGFPEPQDSENA